MLLLLFACTAAPDADTGDAATIEILSPSDESVVCGAPLVIQTKVTNFVLVEPFTDDTDPEPGTGHVDVALNGQEEDDWMFGGETLALPDIADGYYQVRVELSNADHTPIEPYAGDLVYVTVDAGVCE
jgi:hypothetical protein